MWYSIQMRCPCRGRRSFGILYDGGEKIIFIFFNFSFMKKVFSIAAVVTCMCVSTVFAEYTLSPADTAVVQEVVQKLQAKPIRTQEAVIKALKNAQNKTNFTEQKKALFAAVET